MISISHFEVSVEVEHLFVSNSNELIFGISELELMIDLYDFFFNGSELFSMFILEGHVHFEVEKLLLRLKLVRNDEVS